MRVFLLLGGLDRIVTSDMFFVITSLQSGSAYKLPAGEGDGADGG